MKKKIVSVLILVATGTTLLAGCGNRNNLGTESDVADTSEEEGKVVNIYCWNDEFKQIYEVYAKDLEEKHGVEVNFVIISSDNNAYQINLDEALEEQDEAIDDDKVDMFLIEADYAGKYIKSDYVLDVVSDVGLTEDDLKDQYNYTKEIVSDNGVQKATTWQATPGLLHTADQLQNRFLEPMIPNRYRRNFPAGRDLIRLRNKCMITDTICYRAMMILTVHFPIMCHLRG